MSNPPIRVPAGFATASALAFADAAGRAVPVDSENPLPIGERPYRGAVALVPDSSQAPGRGVAVVASQPGTVRFRLDDDSQLDCPVEAGLTLLPLAVRAVLSAGTSAAIACHTLL